MNPVFPTIGEYNRLFQKLGGGAFKTLHGIELIPSRTSPIKVFLFGSGAYAAVFKGRHEGKTYAIRCFLTAEGGTINRYRAICNHLEHIQEDWITDSEFLKDEIEIDYETYPILKMEWVDGLLINEFIDQNLSDKNILKELQSQLVAISNSLESNNIGHGDLQCGNIIVTGSSSNFQIRLIDYDGMYVPELSQMQSIELGRSEFQHPKRSKLDFNPEMDRFSFWVMLTALEAIKHDKTLWLEVMQGGFNTLDNFLFTIQDFIDPEQSKLFNRLYNLNSDSLNFYLNELKSLCKRDLASLTKPKLFGSESQNQTKIKDKVGKKTPHKRAVFIDKQVPNGMFKIISEDNDVTILTSTFHKLGSAPLELEKIAFEGKTVIVTNGSIVRQILLSPEKSLIEVNLGGTISREEDQNIKYSKSYAINSIQEADPTILAEKRKNEKEKLEKEEILKQQKINLKQEEEAAEKRRLENKKILVEKAAIEKRRKEEKEKIIKENELRKQEELSKNAIEIAFKITQQQKEEEEKTNLSLAFIGVVVIVVAIFLTIYVNNNKSENIREEYPNAQNTDEAKIISEEIVNYEDNIRGFLRAEEDRDFEKIYSYFSPYIRRYYSNTYPTFSNLKNSYSKIWEITSHSRNTVLSITKIDDNTYDLNTIFDYYDLRKNSTNSSKSKVRFIFDNNGKILETYGLKSTIITKSKSLEELNNEYDYVGPYNDGLALVKLNGKYGYIDADGREVIPIQYNSASDFNGGYAYVTNASGGKYIENTASYTNIEKSETKKEFIVNKSEWDNNYRYVGPISEGLILVYANYKYGFVNSDGKVIINLEYDYAEDFKNGKAKVTFSGREMFINKDGNVVSGS